MSLIADDPLTAVQWEVVVIENLAREVVLVGMLALPNVEPMWQMRVFTGEQIDKLIENPVNGWNFMMHAIREMTRDLLDEVFNLD